MSINPSEQAAYSFDETQGHKFNPDKRPEDVSDEAGRKNDSDKTLAGTLLDFPRALTLVAEVASYGARKYERRNWLEVPKRRERYGDAMMRHLLDAETEDNDMESGLLHEAHFVWNALARLEIRLRCDCSSE